MFVYVHMHHGHRDGWNQQVRTTWIFNVLQMGVGLGIIDTEMKLWSIFWSLDIIYNALYSICLLMCQDGREKLCGIISAWSFLLESWKPSTSSLYTVQILIYDFLSQNGRALGHTLLVNLAFLIIPTRPNLSSNVICKLWFGWEGAANIS